MEKKGLFQFTTKQLVVMAVLAAVSGLFQALWSYVVFQVKVLGPLSPIFTNVGFMLWAFMALYFVPVPGAATLVKFVGAIIEVLAGNPFGPVGIIYGTLEGVAVDLAFLVFKRKMSVNMFIVGALFSQIINGPVDMIRDAVPLDLGAIAVYFAPGVAGTVLTGWLSSLVLKALKAANVKPVDADPEQVEVG